MNFPSKCPHCGKDIADILPSSTHFFPCKKSPGIAASVYSCMHCKKDLYIMRGYIINRATKKPEVVEDCILSCYPLPKKSDYPKSVKRLSPKAYKIFSDITAAEAMGLDSIVGSGLRVALEHLIWDYLIKIKGFSKDELKNLTLDGRIKKIENQHYTQVCAKLIKTFGNDNVHVINRYKIPRKDAFKLYGTLCTKIDEEISLLKTQQRINTNKT